MVWPWRGDAYMKAYRKEEVPNNFCIHCLVFDQTSVFRLLCAVFLMPLEWWLHWWLGPSSRRADGTRDGGTWPPDSWKPDPSPSLSLRKVTLVNRGLIKVSTMYISLSSGGCCSFNVHYGTFEKRFWLQCLTESPPPPPRTVNWTGDSLVPLS